MNPMNKRVIIPFIAAMAVFTSCDEDSFPGLMPDYTDVSDEVPVQVYVGKSSGTVDVKGSGEIENYGMFAGKSIYVFAFSAVDGVRYDAVPSQDDAVPGVLLFGRRATLDGRETLARWADDEIVNYPSRQYCDYPYDFFACYIDDLPLTGIKATADKVSAKVTIDGRNDIMRSKAVPPEGEYFCYNSARRYITPVFKFSHSLVKLSFKAKPGLTPGHNQEVDIHYVKVKSRSTGTFTLASRDGILDFEFDNNTATFELTEKDGSEYVKQSIVTRDNADSDEGIIDLAGGSALLVSPEASYEISIGLSQPGLNGGAPADNVKKIKLSQGEFISGNSYDIIFEVFGRNNVSVGAVLTPWSDPVLLDDITDDQRPEK